MAPVTTWGASLVALTLSVPAMIAALPIHTQPLVDDARPAISRSNPLVSIAGDIACGTQVPAYNNGNGTETQCHQKYTAPLLTGSDAVWTLGDHVYPASSLSELKAVYKPTWGQQKSITYPTPGDHDYLRGARQDYLRYFGRHRSYYSFRIGGWQVFSMDSEVNHSRNSRQVAWLKRKLASTDKDCIAAYWGVPRWTSGPKAPGDASFDAFWRVLYGAHADLAFSGDTHNYERFASQTPHGERAANGVRQFVVGTGGRSLAGFPSVQPNSQVREEMFGVLQLRLHRHFYHWRFLDEAADVIDSGSSRCN